MNCPSCASGLEAQRVGEIEVDVCPGCRGCWFDPGEINRIREIRKASLSPEELRRLEGVGRGATPRSKDRRAPACPRCGAGLAAVNYAYSSAVVIDRCPRCEGIWLDQGELETIEKLTSRWESMQAEDLAQWGPLLAKTRHEVESRLASADPTPPSRRSAVWGVVGAILTLFDRSEDEA